MPVRICAPSTIAHKCSLGQATVLHRFSKKEGATAPAIPAALTTAIAAVTELFNALLTLVSGIVFPAAVTPVSVLAAAGLLLPLIVWAVSFVKRIASSGGGAH